MDVFAAVHAPVNFDVIENFKFSNPNCRRKLKNNPFIMIGNVGEEGNPFIENTPFYKYLDLYANSNSIV